MAVWVHSGLDPDPEEFAPVVRGLVEVSRIAARLQEQFDLPFPVEIGGGINSGFAPLGNLGGDALADFTPLGDAVNKAFRLEAATRLLRCDVAIGDASHLFLKRLPGFPECRQELVQLKGYAGPQKAYVTSFADLAAV
jgi:adenylate cyclase